jgi:hypothetical protein
MEFKALRISTLSDDVASRLEILFNELAGVEKFTIQLDTQELHIVFDEDQLSFRRLVQEMTKAGCSLQQIDAALLL